MNVPFRTALAVSPRFWTVVFPEWTQPVCGGRVFLSVRHWGCLAGLLDRVGLVPGMLGSMCRGCRGGTVELEWIWAWGSQCGLQWFTSVGRLDPEQVEAGCDPRQVTPRVLGRAGAALVGRRNRCGLAGGSSGAGDVPGLSSHRQ